MDEITKRRIAKVALRLLNNQMRLAVAKVLAADDDRWGALISYEEATVQSAQEAYRKAVSWASVDLEALRDLIESKLLEEASEQVFEHFVTEGIPQGPIHGGLAIFGDSFKVEEMLCPVK